MNMADITRIECGNRMSMAVVHKGIVYLAGQVGKPGDNVTCLLYTSPSPRD